jgi:hypothetical protein
MSVNLDRLREAMSELDICRCEECDEAAKALDAILDAPRVWWCEVIRDTETDPSECDYCDPALGCGWVVLVPVEGEGN